MLSVCLRQALSRKFSSDNIRKIVVGSNGVVACWHPEPNFPYEHSRPIELKQEEKQQTTNLSSAVQRVTRRPPSNVELKEIFYTDKNEWFSRTREERLRSVAAPIPNSFKVINFGKISYEEGLKQQLKYVELTKISKLADKSRNFLLVLEHHPVYTVGIRSKQYSAEEESRLKKLGAEFHRTSRGGLITFHGPGQLVMYPIFDVKRISPKSLGVRLFVEKLEQVIIDCATHDFGIKDVGRTKNTGVWVGSDRKLAALGIAVSHGISYHGLALNCNTDLSWYKNIVACGIEDAEATSLSRECHRSVSIAEALPCMIRSFAKNFECLIDEDHFNSISRL